MKRLFQFAILLMLVPVAQGQNPGVEAYVNRYGNPALYKKVQTDSTVRNKAIHALATMMVINYLDNRGDDPSPDEISWLVKELGPFSIEDYKWLRLALDAGEQAKAQIQSIQMYQELGQQRVKESTDYAHAQLGLLPASAEAPQPVQPHPQQPSVSAPAPTRPVGGAGIGAGSGTTGLYRIGGGVSAPVPIHSPEAEYSDEARKAKVQGVVLVAVIVDAQGNPQNPRVIRGLGMDLNEKALEAVRKYTFKPALKDGKTPVPVMITIEVNFRLY